MLRDISDHSDTNFIYLLSANKCQQQIRKNNRKKTLKQIKHQMKSQFVYKHLSHVTKAAGIEVLLIPKTRAFSQKQICSRKSRSTQERCSTKLALDQKL